MDERPIGAKTASGCEFHQATALSARFYSEVEST